MQLLFLLIASLGEVFSFSNPLDFTFSSSGQYTLISPEQTYTSSPVSVLSGGEWLSSENGTLVGGALAESTGMDAWGDFMSSSLMWSSSSGGATLLVTSIYRYLSVPAVTFEVTFPSGVVTGSSLNDSSYVMSTFPSWSLPGSEGDLGWFQWAGTMLNEKNDAGPQSGLWHKGSNFSAGLGSGPIVLFNSTGANSLIFSPASNFMALSAASNGVSLSWGPLGSATSLPPLFSYTVVAWYGPGINPNVMSWGSALLHKFGKPHGLSKTDFTNTHLGYNTDHGGYYYYNVGEYGNYSVLLEKVYEYAQSVGIPYRHILLDSWCEYFYYYFLVGECRAPNSFFFNCSQFPNHSLLIDNFITPSFAPFFF